MPKCKESKTNARTASRQISKAAGAVWVVDCLRSYRKGDSGSSPRLFAKQALSMKVYKNTLMHIALADAELPTLDDMLQGPSAFVFCR